MKTLIRAGRESKIVSEGCFSKNAPTVEFHFNESENGAVKIFAGETEADKGEN